MCSPKRTMSTEGHRFVNLRERGDHEIERGEGGVRGRPWPARWPGRPIDRTKVEEAEIQTERDRAGRVAVAEEQVAEPLGRRDLVRNQLVCLLHTRACPHVVLGVEPGLVVLHQVRRTFRAARVDELSDPSGRGPVRRHDNVGVGIPCIMARTFPEHLGSNLQPPAEHLSAPIPAGLEGDDAGIDTERSQFVNELHDDERPAAEPQLRQHVRHPEAFVTRPALVGASLVGEP